MRAAPSCVRYSTTEARQREPKHMIRKWRLRAGAVSSMSADERGLMEILSRAREWARFMTRDMVALWLAARDQHVRLAAEIVAAVTREGTLRIAGDSLTATPIIDGSALLFMEPQQLGVQLCRYPANRQRARRLEQRWSSRADSRAQ